MIKVKLSQATDEYLRFSQARGLKPNSIKAARQTLDPLLSATGDILVCNMTAMHVERYFTKHSEAWGPVTRNMRLSQLRGFFKWCDQRGYKDARTDLLFGWRGLTVPDKDRLRIPVQEWPKLFAACDHPTDTATLAVGLYLFLRSSEAQALKVGSVRFSDSVVAVWRPKTSTFDEMPMSTELESILREYLGWYTQRLAKEGIAISNDMYLLPARDTTHEGWILGHELDPMIRYKSPHSNLGRRVREILERAGYTRCEDEGWGGHVLRRSGARALFDHLVTQGYDGALKTTQAMLGHKNSVMTERYLGLTLDKEKRNSLLAGKPMFPQSQNVIPMRREA